MKTKASLRHIPLELSVEGTTTRVLPSLLGKGGEGSVYEGVVNVWEDGTMNIIPAATKVVKYQHEGNNSGGSRFPCKDEVVKEALLLSQLSQSKFIVEFFGYFVMDGFIALVLERLKLINIYNLVGKAPVNLIPGLSATIMIPIIDALRVVHSLGYIHSDVKLGNILLSSNLVPKLFDFGLSVKQGQKLKGGTQLYFPPETISNPNFTATSKVDSWAIGVALGYLVKGQSICKILGDGTKGDLFRMFMKFPTMKNVEKRIFQKWVINRYSLERNEDKILNSGVQLYNKIIENLLVLDENNRSSMANLISNEPVISSILFCWLNSRNLKEIGSAGFEDNPIMSDTDTFQQLFSTCINFIRENV